MVGSYEKYSLRTLNGQYKNKPLLLSKIYNNITYVIIRGCGFDLFLQNQRSHSRSSIVTHSTNSYYTSRC